MNFECPLIQIYIAITFDILGCESAVPEFFDARKKWPKCPSISKIRDQGDCRSDWAVAAAAMMSDRLCISTKGKEQFEFSAQEFLLCCEDCFKYALSGTRCDTARHARGAVEFLVEHGAPSEFCKPYDPDALKSIPVQTTEPTCEATCINKAVDYENDKRFAKGHFEVFTEKNAQIEIMKSGPIVARIWYPEAFRRYFQDSNHRSEIYNVQENGTKTQNVKIIGWGEEGDLPYWLVANSWGTDWGDGGFFKIARGKDMLEIELKLEGGSFDQEEVTPSLPPPLTLVVTLPGAAIEETDPVHAGAENVRRISVYLELTVCWFLVSFWF